MEEIFFLPIKISFQGGNNLFLAIASEVSGSRKNCFPLKKRPYSMAKKKSLPHPWRNFKQSEKIPGCVGSFFDALRFRAYSKKKILRSLGFFPISLLGIQNSTDRQIFSTSLTRSMISRLTIVASRPNRSRDSSFRALAIS